MNTQQCTYARRGRDGLAQIGLSRLDVAGIRYFNDGGDAGGGTGGQQQANQDEQQQNNDPTPPWGDDPSKFDPNKAWTLIQNLKGDIATEKQKREDAITAAVAKATEDASKKALADFGKLLTGEQAPETDPAKLNEALTGLKGQLTEKDTALTQAQEQVKAANLALQVAIHAPALGGNTALLLANEQFKTSIGSVEPTDEAAIKAAITKALQENAALKQPPRSSGDIAPTGPTIQSLEAQLKAADEKRDVKESIRLKRLIAAARSGQA